VASSRLKLARAEFGAVQQTLAIKTGFTATGRGGRKYEEGVWRWRAHSVVSRTKLGGTKEGTHASHCVVKWTAGSRDELDAAGCVPIKMDAFFFQFYDDDRFKSITVGMQSDTC
jgi:hypothetical protein